MAKLCLLVMAMLVLLTASLLSLPNGNAGRSNAQANERSIAVPPGSKMVNPEGSCLSFTGLNDAIIENLVVGPCAAHGIELHDSHNVTIRNVVIADTVESGIYITGSASIVVEESRISKGVSGVYALDSSGIRVSCNTIENPRGPIPRGQFVQFDKVSGRDNRISCNAGLNGPGQGTPEDAISLYKSQGTPESPIAVTDNLIVGGGPSASGGGIMLGDDGGAYQVAEGNVLVDPGQYGIAVSSGNHMSILNNLVFARRQSFTNVGISTWNQYPHACHTIVVEGNKVNWVSKSGEPNPFWDGENCGEIKGIEHNEFSAALSSEIADAKSPQCGCRTEGRR